MRWLDPLFVHFHVSRRAVEACVPDGLRLELDGDEALISIAALGAIGPAPALVLATPLRRLVRYRQLNVRTYVTGPEGPGLLFLDVRVDHLLAAAPRVLGLPFRRDAELRYEVDAAAVALRAGGIEVRGLPSATTKPLGNGLERRALDRHVIYGRSPLGPIWWLRVRHEAWRVRPVELAPDSTLALPELTPLGELAPVRALSAQLAQSVDVELDGLAAILRAVIPAGRRVPPFAPAR